MPRSGKEARARLERAALELVGARGFDAVTAAEIAEHAGLTERTFFRHFPDKREALFNGEQLLTEWVTEAIDAVPGSTPALATLQAAFVRVAPLLEGNRAAGDPLARIIAANPALQERLAAKEAHLVAVLTAALERRGVAPDDAAIAAGAGWTVMTRATVAWRATPGARLADHVDRGFAALRSLVV